jgi:hypothetical protein
MTNTPNTAENALRKLFGSLFAEILLRDSQDDYQWKRRLRSFKVNGLLSFRMPNPVQVEDFVVDNDRLKDARYRRFVIRKLQLPRPRKHTYVHLPVERELICDPQYVADIATLLAWNWVRKLLPVSSPHEMALLLQYDVATLTRALNTMSMHQSSGENVARLRLRAHVQDVIDNHEGIQRVFSDLEDRFDAIGARTEQSLLEWAAEQQAKDEQRLADMKRRTDAMFDAAIARIHAA